MKLDWRPIPWNAPSAKGPVRVIALMQDPGVIRRILEHLGLWVPQVKDAVRRSIARAGPRTPVWR